MTIENVKVDAALDRLARVELATLPTPIQELKRFSELLGGPRIFMKRDDLTGLAGGGNKTRKLEYLLGDAIAKNADCLVTAGAIQSNHCRQTAAAAAKYGMDCHLVIGSTPSAPKGNYFIDQLLGAKFHWTEKHLRNVKMESVANDLRAQEHTPYVIPIGGSNEIGAMGYVKALAELQTQLNANKLKIDRLIFATSSGGTQAGVVVGTHALGFKWKATGISIDQVPDANAEFKYREFVLDIVKKTAKQLNIVQEFTVDDIDINYDYLGAGYGVIGELEREAVRMLASSEGILIGPVYTGRALGALIDLVRKNRIGKNENVLFLHTGDDIALHAYVDDFIGASS